MVCWMLAFESLMVGCMLGLEILMLGCLNIGLMSSYDCEPDHSMNMIGCGLMRLHCFCFLVGSMTV